MKKARRIEIPRGEAARRAWALRWRDARVPMAVCLLALLVYSRSLLCGFVRDDIPQIVNNRQVQSWEYLPQLLGSHLWSQMTEDVNILFYRPIFSVWMLLMHTFGGLTPWFWHLSNVVLHLVATYLVFTLCRRLTRSDAGALAAAAIFALHPIHVDAVTWVSASCEILFTIFALAAMLALLPSRKESSPRVWVSALWFGAGLFAKETEIAMLPLLAVFAWVQIRERAQGGQRLWNAASPYGTVTAVYLLARWAVMHRVGLESGEHTWAEVVFSAPSIFLFYLKKLFLPSNLSGCYVNPLTASPNGTFWLQLTVCFVCLAAIAWFAFRYSRLLGPAFALIVIPVLPALAVIRIYPQGDMTHDRYLYLPSVGLALLVATLVQQAWSLQKPAKIAVTVFVIAVAGVFSAETVLQQRYYQDDLTFYHRAIAVSPSDSFVRGMLGNVYLDQRRSDLAIEEFQKAHQISPENQKATLFLARGLFVVGKHHEAETVLKELLETRDLTPRRREAALLSLANVEIGLGNLDSAQQLLQQVDRSDDAFPELHWALGVVYQKQGLLPQALAEYEKEVDTTGDELARQRSAALAKLIYSQSAGRALKESGQR